MRVPYYLRDLKGDPNLDNYPHGQALSVAVRGRPLPSAEVSSFQAYHCGV